MEKDKTIIGYKWEPECDIVIKGKDWNTFVRLSQLSQHLTVFVDNIMKDLIDKGIAKPIFQNEETREN